ncbi:MAG: Rap1a/Tai family immunity protein [Halioglobus sp.]
MRKFIFVLILFALTLPAFAGYKSAYQLQQDCEENGTGDIAMCLGYLAGVSDAAAAITDWELGKEKGWCTPMGVTLGQLRQVFLKWAEERPEKLHNDAGSIVLDSLDAAFPCE